MERFKLIFLKLQVSAGVAGAVTLLSLSPGLATSKPAVITDNVSQPALTQLREAEVLNNRGVELSDRGEHQAASEAFNQAIAIYPNYEIAYSNLGIALGNQGKFTEAIAAFDRALEINPNNWETYNNLGIALGMQGELARAVEAFDRAIEINPQAPVSYRNLAIAHWRQQQVPEAIAALKQARTLYLEQNQLQEVERIDEILPKLSN